MTLRQENSEDHTFVFWDITVHFGTIDWIQIKLCTLHEYANYNLFDFYA